MKSRDRIPRRRIAGLAALFLLATGSGGALAQNALTLDEVKSLAVDAFLHEKLPELLSSKSDVFNLKYIDPDTEGQKGGWAIDYEWKTGKSSAPSSAPADGQPFTFGRLNYELAVNGSYAINDAQNNQDLSTIKASFKLERGNFGKLEVIDSAISSAFLKCLNALPAPMAPEEVAPYDRESRRCIEANGIDKAV